MKRGNCKRKNRPLLLSHMLVHAQMKRTSHSANHHYHKMTLVMEALIKSGSFQVWNLQFLEAHDIRKMVPQWWQRPETRLKKVKFQCCIIANALTCIIITTWTCQVLLIITIWNLDWVQSEYQGSLCQHGTRWHQDRWLAWKVIDPCTLRNLSKHLKKDGLKSSSRWEFLTITKWHHCIDFHLKEKLLLPITPKA